MDSSVQVNLLEDQSSPHRRNHNRPSLFTIISLILLVIIIIGSTVAALITYKRKSDSLSISRDPYKAVGAVCSYTPYPRSCRVAIATINNNPPETHPQRIFCLSLQVAINKLSNTSSSIRQAEAPQSEKALIGCLTLLNESRTLLDKSLMFACVDSEETELTRENIGSTWEWIDAAISDQLTCLRWLEKLMRSGKERTAVGEVWMRAWNSKIYTRNCLGIVEQFHKIIYRFNNPTDKDFGTTFMVGLQYLVLIFLLCLFLRIY